MPKVKIKICGITNLEDAIISIKAGCDALGFVFYKKSPRYISPLKAKLISSLVPKRIIKIGVFVNEEKSRIKRITRSCRLDMLQFHGEETPDFCAKFKGDKIIKAFRVKKTLDIKGISKYKTFAYLFDSFAKNKFGGTGKRFNWQLLKKINNIKRPIFLSGGLNSKNLKQAILSVRPDWVDVSTAVEISPGKKDYRKIKSFIKAAKG